MNLRSAFNYTLFLPYFFIIFLIGCEEPYTPPAIMQPGELLVVEGFIEVNDVSVFKISKTRKLSDGNIEKPVDQATLFIEGEDQSKYPLSLIGNGTYQSYDLSLNTSIKYRLKIILENGIEYISDYVEPRIAPPIDSIGWQASTEGVQLYIDTHDPLGKSRYYKWTYNEDWEYSTPFPSLYIYDPLFSAEYHNIRVRVFPEEEMPLKCFTSAISSTIILGNSTALNEDIIYNLPFYKIDLNSNRLQWRYSIEVKQLVLTKEAFQYWEGLKKLSTNMGSLFDVQPYQLIGNIHKVNSDEMVIGFISAGSKSTKRIFIDKMQLPLYKLKTRYDDCVALPDPDYKINYANPQNVPLGLFRDPKDPEKVIQAYTTLYCSDCSKSGKVEPPDFW